MKCMHITVRSLRRSLAALLVAAFAVCGLPQQASAQTAPEFETASIRMGKLWIGVSANGARATFDYTSGFFPNDYDVFGNRGQNAEAYGGMGLLFSTTDWRRNPTDTLIRVAIYGPTNDFMRNGMVVTPLRNYIRYQFPAQTVDYQTVGLTYPGLQEPANLTGTCDQMIEVTTQHVFRVNVHRKLMVWSQSLNDNYIIVDLELTNVGSDTLENFYINMNAGNTNMQISSNRNPTPPATEAPVLPATWMHYYGGRVGDSLRVFYEYSASNVDRAGDNMGAPIVSQGGRLAYSQMTFFTILHASRAPYDNPAADADDFTQPKVTYMANINNMPSPGQDDEFGNRNYFALRGAFSDKYPMDTMNAWPGTHHGFNNDELGIADFSNYVSGTKLANDQRRYATFGPYTFLPGQKLRIVYACGKAGLDLRKAHEVGKRWLAGTLEDAPGLPDPEKGFLPANFVFPTGATEMDKRKDRWISTGIDSVMKTASRAKWNFDHGYNIPQAPPPPDRVTITGHGDGVEVAWADAAAELFPNFAGYRIMRRTGNQDTSYYQEIYSSGPDDRANEHIFKDVTAKVGGQYYYYIQAKALIGENDLNADPSSRGRIIYSGRTLVPDYTKINPKSPPQGDMEKIRIVPNPYNINDPLIAAYGWTTQPQQLFFVNLPAQCMIRIFTENGDLVKEYSHNERIKTGSWNWDMLNANGQFINSGVYIAVFENPDGDISYHKFVVVR